ncbi:MAG: hypothetical protein ABJA64_01865 [Candidatus Saccharibacteria bacterium]
MLNSTDNFFILDFDRCLANEKLYDLFDKVSGEIIDIELLRQARKQVEAEAGSFDTFQWLRETCQLSDASVLRLTSSYVMRADQLGSQTFLANGAKELLTYLSDSDIPHMIMTYGGHEYQELKIRAAGLQAVPCRVVPSKEKGHYVAQWWSEEDQKFIIPTDNGDVRSSSVVLVDDKAAAFTRLPRQAVGYLVRGEGRPLKSQLGEIPANVKECAGLSGVLADLKHRYHS